ncbi:phage head-tail connector protein [Vibrio sp. ER1A]|uniref:phage head-tail connector protein n=1 Tax=Vibrio sp. ER1A TaxID=1517681 RepID=UPI00068E02A3|nr:phage head-tail connector protein [Vibrio sp. ER1A]
MHFKVINKPDIGEELLPMSEINDHLRIYDPHEEELLAVYRSAAIDFAEQYMNRALGKQTVQATFDKYRERTYLPFGDIQEITRITALNDNDDLIELPISDYRFNAVSNEVHLKHGNAKYKDFIITYVAGSEASETNNAIKVGIMKLIATWYESREDISHGVSVSQVPFNHQYCFNLYRIPAGI